MEPQEEIVRLMVLQLRMQLPSQSEVINELYRAGFGPARIAQLLGTTANTVNVAVQRAKKKSNSKKRG
jgi:DNA-directed RNA polymerase specialized sigma24 family protein